MKSLRRLLIVFFIGLIALFIQGTLIKAIAPTSLIVPNIIAVIVAFLAFQEPTVFGVCLSFLLGLEFDLSSGILVGPWSAAFVAVFGLLSMVSQRVFVESPLAIFVSVLVAVVVANVVYVLIVLQFHATALTGISLAVIGEGFFSALIAPIVFRILRRVLR